MLRVGQNGEGDTQDFAIVLAAVLGFWTVLNGLTVLSFARWFYAPTGRKVIAQGKAKRHPGCAGYDIAVGTRPRYVHRALVSPWVRSALSGLATFDAYRIPGRRFALPWAITLRPVGA